MNKDTDPLKPTPINRMWVGSDLYHIMLTPNAPNDPATNEPVLGRCDVDNRVILVMRRSEHCAQLQCLFHEFIHAIEGQMGMEIDETAVRLISRGLGQAVWQNLGWLAETTLCDHPDISLAPRQTVTLAQLCRPEGS